MGDFKRYPVSATAASFIGLLCENPCSSCGDFHALNFNGGIMFPSFKKDFYSLSIYKDFLGRGLFLRSHQNQLHNFLNKFLKKQLFAVRYGDTRFSFVQAQTTPLIIQYSVL